MNNNRHNNIKYNNYKWLETRYTKDDFAQFPDLSITHFMICGAIPDKETRLDMLKVAQGNELKIADLKKMVKELLDTQKVDIEIDKFIRKDKPK